MELFPSIMHYEGEIQWWKINHSR